MKWGASEEGSATDKVSGVGGSYQAGDNASEEKLRKKCWKSNQ